MNILDNIRVITRNFLDSIGIRTFAPFVYNVNSEDKGKDASENLENDVLAAINSHFD